MTNLSNIRNITIKIVLVLLLISVVIVVILNFMGNNTSDRSDRVADVDLSVVDPSDLNEVYEFDENDPGQITSQKNAKQEINSLLPFKSNGFTINYPSYNVYDVYVDNKESEVNARQWLSEKNFDFDKSKINYIYPQDEDAFFNLIQNLPITQDDYHIYFSAKTEKLVVNYKDNSAKENAIKWANSQGVDLGKYKVAYIQDETLE